MTDHATPTMVESANSPALWGRLRAVAPRALTPTRALVHHAVQWLAKAARANIAPSADDSHSSLTWTPSTPGGGRFETAPLGDGGARLCLALPALTLELRSSDPAAPLIALYGLTGQVESDIAAWLDTALTQAGLATVSSVVLPYRDLPPSPVASGAPYQPETTAPNGDGVAVLADWFTAAEASLRGAIAPFAAKGGQAPGFPRPSPLRLWPHHFDLASLVVLEDAHFETARSIGLGFSPGDGSYDQPYFYAAPWPKPEPMTGPPLEVGHWRYVGFAAAVSPGTTLVEHGDAAAALARHHEIAIGFWRRRLGA